MKNIRKFNTTAAMDAATLEDVSVNYNVETGGVVTVNKPSVIDYSAMYTTFEALEDGTFSFTKIGTGEDIQYSKDNGSTWTPLASGETVSVVTGDKVMWKSTITPGYGRKSGIGYFSSNNKFNVYGNSMSLLYGDNFKEQTSLEGKDGAFDDLFKNCSYLIEASTLILPATTLGKSCYADMFSGCTSLTTAPELPATTLSDNCYYGMFNGCSSLTTAPELPVTTLSDNCYYGMFKGCSSLTTAPELPATTLANDCYLEMFSDCTSLTIAPELLATTLAIGCYYVMFQGCTNLTTAPELPATTLANDCYLEMFKGCTSLTTAPELPATTLARACYRSMFSGCTSLTTAPELPATTLADYCYYGMFNNCESLTNAPELPATTLANSCYYSMFSGCTSLKHITMLATNISEYNCLNNWVNNVSSTGTFVKHPDMTSLPTGTSGIPNGWTVEDAVL